MVKNLCYASIKYSPDFEGITEDEKRQFVSANVMIMMPLLFAINDFGQSHIPKDIEAIKRVEHIRKIKESREVIANAPEEAPKA